MSDCNYEVQLGPTVAPVSTSNGETSYTRVFDAQTFQNVRASKIKYSKEEMAHFELVDEKGQITFSAPLHMLIWIRKMDSSSLATVTSIGLNLRLVEDIAENHAIPEFL